MKRFIAAALAIGLVLVGSQASAISLIRDAEIEGILADISEPLFASAGLDPDSVNIFIVNDNSLNAFVAGGQNLFIHTGLLQRAETLDQVSGVIAHEAGHIAGGHLTRLGQASQAAGTEALIGALLGAAAAVAGAPQLGTAIIAGGATVAERNLLAFSRAQEQSADQAAIGYLYNAGLSPRGLLEFMEILQNQNLRINAEGSEFLRTHPLTRDRILFLEGEYERSPLRNEPTSPESIERHQRMKAKLDGFLGERARTWQEWTGDSMPARYARSISDYRSGRIDDALATLASLIEEAPDDPYLQELDGQILFESGRIDEAVEPYRMALAGLPDSALIRLGLARALMERGGDQADLQEAVDLLTRATQIEPFNPSMWRFLGIAHGRLGNQNEADLALAEAAILRGNRDDANLYLRRARQNIQSGDPGWIKLQDLTRARDEMRVER